MVNVASVTTRAVATVSVEINGAPPLVATYQTRSFLPQLVTVEFLYKPQRSDEGWVTHRWEATSVIVVGPRILKPASDGSQRLGVENLRYDPGYGEKKPEWLTKLMAELAPSGDIAVAGE